jgi:hypothetical protein
LPVPSIVNFIVFRRFSSVFLNALYGMVLVVTRADTSPELIGWTKHLNWVQVQKLRSSGSL